MRVILASGSPRRRELLKQITEEFEVITADVDESSTEAKLKASGEYKNEADLAVRTVRELSRAKAFAVFEKLDQPADTLIIGADTVVALEDEILGKPKDREDAVRMLRAQSLQPQRVITGVTLVIRSADGTGPECGSCCGFQGCCSAGLRDTCQEDCKASESDALSTKLRTFTEETLVYFRPLDEAQEQRIQQYCDTDEPYDKAGAYGIQLHGSSLVDHYEGDYNNIVGFPVKKVREEIMSFIT